MRRPAVFLAVVSTMLIAAAGGPSHCKGVPEEVPPSFVSVYATLDSQLHQLAKSVRSRGVRKKSDPTFGAHLLAADSNLGPALLRPVTLAGVEFTLDRFQELDIEGITLAIGYPLLTSDFPDAASYLAFYKSVAEAVRRRGMTLAVEQIILFANSEFSPFEIDLSDLTLARFTDESRQMAQTIIDELAPDYLTVIHEPDAYAVLTGLEEFHSPELAVGYVEDVLDGLSRGDTLIGAGAVNYNDLSYYVGFAETDIDYLDVHVYSIDPDSVRNTLRIAKVARRNRKQLVFSEAWLYKTDGADIAAQANLTGWAEGFRRDVFSFWEPLDIRFQRVLTRLARRTGAAYVSPFWTNYYFAYLEYGPDTADLSYQTLVSQMAPAAVAAAIIRGDFTQTGLCYSESISRGRARPPFRPKPQVALADRDCWAHPWARSEAPTD